MAAKREPRLVSLGYGKFARADRIYALVPLDPKDRGEGDGLLGVEEPVAELGGGGGLEALDADRGDGRRTYVHVDGVDEPIVASRSERAILAEIEAALDDAAGIARKRRASPKGQEKLI